MSEKRKKFGMEMLPSLHKRLKQLAADREVPLWSLTQQAIEQWLLRGTPEKDEPGMKTSTDGPKIVNKIGTFDLSESPSDLKIASIGHAVDDQTEISSSERISSEIPATRAHVARIEAKIDRLIQNLAKSRIGVDRVASPMDAAKKTSKRADRVKRLDTRRKGRHPGTADAAG